ncbi:MAG: hypothetical protein AAGA18_15100 [Verrucomicrobiota bacterium]
MIGVLTPEEVAIWFPPDRQKRYARHITGQRNLSPIQAKYFVKLWGYAYLKRKGPPYEPIQTLDNNLYNFPFPFSQDDACKLFYAEKEDGGTPRAAGLMLKKFADDKRDKLIQYQRFEGTKTEITLNIPSEFELPNIDPEDTVYADEFDRRRDILPVTKALKELYSINPNVSEAELEFNIRRGLRNWSKRYPKGMRVIRRASDKEAIGFLTIMPVDPESERQFCLDPAESLHLSQFSSTDKDPIKIAAENDQDCYIAYIRSWQIQRGLWTRDNILALIEETKKTLQLIHNDYPELSEIYSMTIHPRLGALAKAIGFATTSLGSATALSWLSIHLDTFLAINSEEILSTFTYEE